ncbi:hypothetical protein [Thioalkalivibrio sp. ALMg11]
MNDVETHTNLSGESVAQIQDQTPEDLVANTAATARDFYSLPDAGRV